MSSAGSSVTPSAACRSRTWRRTAVFRPLKLKSNRYSRAGAFRSGCVSRVDGSRIAGASASAASRSMIGPPGYPKSEELRHLVVGLPRGIVSRAADQPILSGLRHQIQARVPTRHDEHDGRRRDLAVLEPERFDVPGQMIDGNQRLPRRPRRALRERHAHEQRPDEPGPFGDRDRVEIRPPRRRIGERALDDAADVAHVLPRRDLGNDATPLAMDLDLRRDDARAHRHGGAPLAAASTTAAAVSSQDVSMPRTNMMRDVLCGDLMIW